MFEIKKKKCHLVNFCSRELQLPACQIDFRQLADLVEFVMSQ